MVKPAISVWRPEKLCRPLADDGDDSWSGGRATAGARMTVESGSPVLVVKTVLSVLEARRREQPDELLERHVLGVDARQDGHDVAAPRRPSWRRRSSGRGSPGCRRCGRVGDVGGGRRRRGSWTATGRQTAKSSVTGLAEDVAGDVADGVGPGVEQGHRVEVVGQRSLGREGDLLGALAAGARVEVGDLDRAGVDRDVTSSAVPRMPSGPALMTLIEAAVKWVRSMFLLVVIVNWTWPLVSEVSTWRPSRA